MSAWLICWRRLKTSFVSEVFCLNLWCCRIRTGLGCFHQRRLGCCVLGTPTNAEAVSLRWLITGKQRVVQSNIHHFLLVTRPLFSLGNHSSPTLNPWGSVWVIPASSSGGGTRANQSELSISLAVVIRSEADQCPVGVNLGAWLELVGKTSSLLQWGYPLGAAELHCGHLIAWDGGQPRRK